MFYFGLLKNFAGAVCTSEASFTSFILKASHRSCLVKFISSTHPSLYLMTNQNTSLNVITSLRSINVLEIMELQNTVSCTSPSNCRLSVFPFLIILHFTIENVSLPHPHGFHASACKLYSLVTGKSCRWVQRNCCQPRGSTQGLSLYSPFCHWEV